MIEVMTNGVKLMHRLTLSAALPLALIACTSSGEAVAGSEPKQNHYSKDTGKELMWKCNHI